MSLLDSSFQDHVFFIIKTFVLFAIYVDKFLC